MAASGLLIGSSSKPRRKPGLPNQTLRSSMNLPRPIDTTPPMVPAESRKKRKSRSWVWEHFTLTHTDALDGLGYVQCNHCEADGHQGRYKYSGGTSNMSLHLNRKHQISEDALTSASTQPNTPLSSAPSPPQSQASTPQRSITPTSDALFQGVTRRLVKASSRQSTKKPASWSLLLLLLHEALPLRLLQSPLFQAVVPHGLTKQHAIQLLEDQYKVCCDSIGRLIASDALHLTLSLEERGENGIVSVATTLHWVDKNFATFRVLLLVETFPCGLHVSQLMALLSRLYSVVPAVQGRVQVFLASSERLVGLLTSLLPMGSAIVLPSLSHLLATIVASGLSHATALLDKAAAAAAILGTQGVLLLSPWRQTLEMLKLVAAQTDGAVLDLLAADKSQLDGLVALLLPFETAESMLSPEATYGVVVPVLENLRGLVQKCTVAGAIVSKVQAALVSAIAFALMRDPSPHELGISCAMLDPRFKQMPFLTPSVKLQARDALQAACEAVVDVSTEPLPPSPSSMDVNLKDEAAGGGQLAKAMASFFGLASVDKTKVQHEIDVYWEFPPLPFDAASDPIAWWKANQSSFPRLAKLARDYFSIPASCPDVVPARPDDELYSVLASLRSCAAYPSIWDTNTAPFHEV